MKKNEDLNFQVQTAQERCTGNSCAADIHPFLRGGKGRMEWTNCGTRF